MIQNEIKRAISRSKALCHTFQDLTPGFTTFVDWHKLEI